MKLLKDFTGKELENITDEEVSILVNSECVNLGKPLLPKEPIKPEEVNHEPDITLYRLGGSYGGLIFDSIEKANEVLKVIQNTVMYGTDYISGSSIYKATPIKDGSYNCPKEVSTVQCFSAQKADKIKQDFSKYSVELKNYESLKKEYDDASKERQETSDYVWEVIGAARLFRQQRQKYEDFFKEYLELANGDEKQAMVFFSKAYPEGHKYLDSHFDFEYGN